MLDDIPRRHCDDTMTDPTYATTAQRIANDLALLAAHLPIERRMLRAGERVFQAGQPFERLHVLNSGFFKLVTTSPDGREQLVALHFRGDWLGLDGIAAGRYGCDALAMDTGEVWSVRYDALLAACAREPALMNALHAAMSRAIARDRESMQALCTLSADARVADFLRYWTDSLAQRGLRTDRITLCMSRAEIGNYLGMTLESVSRALSRLARGDVIRFDEKGRRDIRIPHVEALRAYIAAA
jgi:CRP/FNR family transcriptional regulator, anaerobic regulatory protein